MLEDHYKSAYNISCVGARDGHKTGLRLLKSPETGVVLISQVFYRSLAATPASKTCNPIKDPDDTINN
ncbi:hypothetical protein HanXRQr2_Chr06g0252221 [Helianthus annuus]|uniref:Uncharacterized protein n=2 Tax=Helianthus annuus TaxID=4232 RepID=A0A9K3IS76_HELAN|nr:hypothetical protein HanXRQr2_Chr06g0252221 [Helianthus annuus]